MGELKIVSGRNGEGRRGWCRGDNERGRGRARRFARRTGWGGTNWRGLRLAPGFGLEDLLALLAAHGLSQPLRRHAQHVFALRAASLHDLGHRFNPGGACEFMFTAYTTASLWT